MRIHSPCALSARTNQDHESEAEQFQTEQLERRG